MTVLNTNLLRHPLNWFTILTMFLIGGFAFHLLDKFIEGKSKPAPSGTGPGTVSQASSLSAN